MPAAVDLPPRPAVTDRPMTTPFQGPGLSGRVLPFALVAVLGEASLALPPGPRDDAAALVSVALLVLVAASFRLPWGRLPRWTSVLVPLAATGAVLALVLATGESVSGVGIIVLAPLLWTALFHEQWESLCVVAAVVAVEVITAVVPAELTAAVIARRAVFWTVLGLLVSISIHGVRDRAQRAQAHALGLQEDLRTLALLEDRDRLSEKLYGSIIHRLMGVGLHLAGTVEACQDPRTTDRLHTAIDEVDATIQAVRAAVFDLTPEPEVIDLDGDDQPALVETPDPERP